MKKESLDMWISLLLLGAFIISAIHDYFSPAKSHEATLIFLLLFLPFLYLILLEKISPLERTGNSNRISKIIERLFPSIICAGAIIFFNLPHYHNPSNIFRFTILSFTILALTGLTKKNSYSGIASASSAFFLLLITSLQPYQGMVFFPDRTPFLKYSVTITLFVFLLCSFLKVRSFYLLCIFLISGVFFRGIAIPKWQINGFIRDMLPLVESALRSLFEGRNPYRVYFLSHDVPLTYLPVMWMTYLPAWVINLDIRWMNIFLSSLTCILIYFSNFYFIKNSEIQNLNFKERVRKIISFEPPSIFLVAVAIFSFHPEIFWNSIHAETPVYWFWLTLMLFCAVKGYYTASSILFGFVIATRHFGIIFFPFYILYLRACGLSFKSIFSHGLLCGATSVIIIAPWVLWNSDSFVFSTVEWLTKYGKANPVAWAYHMGFQSWFYSYKKEDILPILQVILYLLFLVITIIIFFCIKNSKENFKKPVVILLNYSLTYMLVVFSGTMIWKSFLVSPFLFAFAGLAQFYNPQLAKPRTTSISIPIFIILALINVCGIFVAGNALLNWKNREDIKHFAIEKVIPHLRSGDLIVDRSFFNSGHVFQGSALDYEKIPPGSQVTYDLRNKDFEKFERIVIFDGYSSIDLKKDYPDLLSGYRIALYEKRKRSTLYVLTRKFSNCKWQKLESNSWYLSRNFKNVKSLALEFSKKGVERGTRNPEGNFIFKFKDPWQWIGPSECYTAGITNKMVFIPFPENGSAKVVFDAPLDQCSRILICFDDRTMTRSWKELKFEVKMGRNVKKNISIRSEKGFQSWSLGKISQNPVEIIIKRDINAPYIFFFDFITIFRDKREENKIMVPAKIRSIIVPAKDLWY